MNIYKKKIILEGKLCEVGGGYGGYVIGNDSHVDQVLSLIYEENSDADVTITIEVSYKAEEIFPKIVHFISGKVCRQHQ